MGKKSRGRSKPVKAEMPYVVRTFAGLPHESDWVALREMVPAASGTIKINGTDKTVRVCSLLPGANPGLVRPDGEIWIGLQVQHNFGDISRDLAHAVEVGLETAPGNPIAMGDPGVGNRLQDLIAPDSDFAVEVYSSFDYWVDGVDESAPVRSMLQAANESITPTVRLSGVDAAYWTEIGDRHFLRWVMSHDETKLLNALARLHEAGRSALRDDTRLIGSFRAHGLLVPVWDLPPALDADDFEEPAAAFADRLDDALGDTSPLTSAQRSARNGLANRQLTIR